MGQEVQWQEGRGCEGFKEQVWAARKAGDRGQQAQRTVMSGQCLDLQAALRLSQGRKPREPSTGWMCSGLIK